MGQAPKRAENGRIMPGHTGNPGGRPNIAKLLDGFGRSADDVRQKMFKQALDIVDAGPKSTNDACWRYAHDWIAAHVGLRPRKDVDVHIHDGDSEDIDLDSMSPDELHALEVALKRQLGVDDDQDETATVQ